MDPPGTPNIVVLGFVHKEDERKKRRRGKREKDCASVARNGREAKKSAIIKSLSGVTVDNRGWVTGV